MLRRLIFAVALLTSLAMPVAGQDDASQPADEPLRGDEPQHTRPRIGLCLAGGAARGGAHIGVLKVLEDLHVPIDCIAGTSIGSIVGGLYAAGMSPTEMDSLLSGLDWFDLFDDSPPRRFNSFRRKEEDHLPYFDFEMGLGKGGLKLPAGFIGGAKLMFLLRALTMPVHDVRDFDDLPIPYRSVASSLDDGTVVIIGEGTVADAMRASMAIPGAFTPHELNGQTLVDGGVLRNVPYDVVKAMGADIVIVVDVGKPLEQLERDPSLVGVLSKTLDVAIAANARESLAEATGRDVVLVPDLVDFQGQQFDRMGEAAERGVAVAQTNRDALSRLSLPEAEYEAWRQGVRASYVEREIWIDAIRIDSSSRVDPRRIRMQIENAPGERLDLELLGEDMSRIYRIGEFEAVDFTLEPAKDPRARDLVIDTRDKRWGPSYLKFGLALEGYMDGQSRFMLAFYHRLAAINRLGAEWRNQIALGDYLGLDTEFYQPLNMSGLFFVAPRMHGTVDKRQMWFDDDVSELVRSKAWGGNLDLGLAMSHWGELRLGAYRGNYLGTGENDFVDLDENLGGLSGRLAFDQLDSIDFPRRGWEVIADARFSRADLGATTEYDRLQLLVRGAATRGRFTLFGRAEGGTSLHTDLPFHDRFELGGFSRLSGYKRGRLFGDEMALAVAGLQMRIARLAPSLGRNVYAGATVETGQAWAVDDEPHLSDLVMGGMVYLGVETLAAPLYFSWGWAEGGHHTFYLRLGRVF